jgi:hypothetical protein
LGSGVVAMHQRNDRVGSLPVLHRSATGVPHVRQVARDRGSAPRLFAVGTKSDAEVYRATL